VVACQTWGLSTRYVGKLGDDDAARLHAGEFERTGVEAQVVYVPETASARSLILVDRRGERTVMCRRDERVVLQPAELKREWIVNARALHVDGHDTAAATLAAGWAREAGIPVVADLDEIYPGVDALIEKIIGADNRADLTIACRAMDRVFRAGRYWVPQWYRSTHPVAYWDVFDHPKTSPRYQIDNYSSSVGERILWWYVPDKAARLEQAK